MIDKELLDILVCPQCKESLEYHPEAQELVCRHEKLAFPIRDDIPVMLLDEARHMEGT
ncbi:MAG: Trm112 family protein [Magnetococcales bacterium]|nr:Trm112 family protein [Magnetococcales bacterium]